MLLKEEMEGELKMSLSLKFIAFSGAPLGSTARTFQWVFARKGGTACVFCSAEKNRVQGPAGKR